MKNIIAVAIASLLLMSSAFAYDPPPCAAPPPDVSGLAKLSEGLARATLWSWLLSFKPATIDCMWLCWAFAEVEGTMKGFVSPSGPSPIKDYPPREPLEPILP